MPDGTDDGRNEPVALAVRPAGVMREAGIAADSGSPRSRQANSLWHGHILRANGG